MNVSQVKAYPGKLIRLKNQYLAYNFRKVEVLESTGRTNLFELQFRVIFQDAIDGVASRATKFITQRIVDGIPPRLAVGISDRNAFPFVAGKLLLSYYYSR